MKYILLMLWCVCSFAGAYSYKCAGEKEKFCVVTLSESIEHSGSYQGLTELFLYAPATTTIVVDIAGFGGSAQGTLTLINAIQASKATVITRAVGPVFSGHAFLTLAGDKIMLTGEGIFMVHVASSTNMGAVLCASKYWQLDRGLYAYEKCVANSEKYSKIYNDVFRKLVKPVLTKKELQRFNEGYEVVLDMKTLRSRL